MPGGSLELVCAELAELSAKTRSDASSLILASALTAAAENQLTPIRCLVGNSQAAISTASLADYHFEPKDSLQTWKIPHPAEFDPDPMIQHQTLRDCLRTRDVRSIEALVRECLDASQDLQSLDPVDPRCLVSQWKRMSEAEILLARCGNQLAGLAVLTRDVNAQLVTLEYLGVAKPFRRQGHARRLLKRARASRNPHGGPSTAAAFIAWCDRCNTPAVQLYRTSGFVPGDIHTIWQRRLTSNTDICAIP